MYYHSHAETKCHCRFCRFFTIVSTFCTLLPVFPLIAVFAGSAGSLQATCGQIARGPLADCLLNCCSLLQPGSNRSARRELAGSKESGFWPAKILNDEIFFFTGFFPFWVMSHFEFSHGENGSSFRVSVASSFPLY